MNIKYDNCCNDKGKIDSNLLYMQLKESNKVKIANNSIIIADEVHKCWNLAKNDALSVCELLEQRIVDIISPSMLDTIIRRLKHTPQLFIEVDALDKHSNLINTIDSVINISTLKKEPQNLDFNFSGYLNFRFIPDATIDKAPNFKKYVDTSFEGSLDKLQLLLEIIGYSISNSYYMKQACFFVGLPHCGKSLLLRLISDVYGPDRINNFTLSELSARFSTSHLLFRHLNINGDNEGDILKNVSKFKQILGGDRLMGEQKGQDAFMFLPRVHLLFGCNKLPDISDIQLTTAYTDRIALLKFPISINRENWDPLLYEKLYEERDIIFSLAVTAFSRLYNENKVFSIDRDSMELLEWYKLNTNSVLSFIHEECVFDESSRIFSSTFLAAFTEWCKELGIQSRISSTAINSVMKSHPGIICKKFRINGSSPRYGFIGIRLKGGDE